jgi:hypothetical protein
VKVPVLLHDLKLLPLESPVYYSDSEKRRDPRARPSGERRPLTVHIE